MIAGGISLVVTIVLFLYYKHARALLDEIWAVDTYTAGELRRMCSGGFDATVEVAGKVSCDKPIMSPVSEIPCCWYRVRVERQERRVRTTRVGAETYHIWTTGLDRTASAIFKVTDETGYTLVDPTNADIEAEAPHVVITGEREPWFGAMGCSDTGEYRITEELFLPGGDAYVLGLASSCGEDTSPDVLVHYPGEGYMNPKRRLFIISRKSEKELVRSQQISAKICLWGMIVGLLLAAYCGLHLLGLIP